MALITVNRLPKPEGNLRMANARPRNLCRAIISRAMTRCATVNVFHGSLYFCDPGTSNAPNVRLSTLRIESIGTSLFTCSSRNGCENNVTHFEFKLRKIAIARPMADFALGTIFSIVPFVMFSKLPRFPFFGLFMRIFRTEFSCTNDILLSCCNWSFALCESFVELSTRMLPSPVFTRRFSSMFPGASFAIASVVSPVAFANTCATGRTAALCGPQKTDPPVKYASFTSESIGNEHVSRRFCNHRSLECVEQNTIG